MPRVQADAEMPELLKDQLEAADEQLWSGRQSKRDDGSASCKMHIQTSNEAGKQHFCATNMDLSSRVTLPLMIEGRHLR